MNVLVVGSGAREHALVWKLVRCSRVSKVFAAPGNAGTASLAENLPIKVTDIAGLVSAITANNIFLTVIGPETTLAAGLADHLLIRGMHVFGPTQVAAEIESSKVFAKDFMQRHDIPHAESQSFSNLAQALKHAENIPFPLVIKADGLSQGKGVIIADDFEQAREALNRIMKDRIFGNAGDRVVIEQYLAGREVSTFSFTDAHSTSPVVAACDYKPVYDGNKGPNTGGMGSYSPPEFFDPELSAAVYDEIMQPTVHYMHEERRPYKGILYSGLILTDDGPKVLEFNARFGDPETQVILPRLKTDLTQIAFSISDNQLNLLPIEWSDQACIGVVMSSGGYPGEYRSGYPVTGLEDVDDDIMVFHAGTSIDSEGKIVTSGGRVLTVVATAATLSEAREKAYDNVRRIKFKDCYYRKDIGLVA